MNLDRLFDPFPKRAISWRAQRLVEQKDGTYKAVALAYIDARDVMSRLDTVVGAENWQNDYPHANGKTVCRIGIKVGSEWIWKSDGAGDTDIEADKGAMSDAFKRAAVRWGIGRYLYDLPAPLVPCRTFTGRDGKHRFGGWLGDCWESVRGEVVLHPSFKNVTERNAKAKEIIAILDSSKTLDELEAHEADYRHDIARIHNGHLESHLRFVDCIEANRSRLRHGGLSEQDLDQQFNNLTKED